MPSSFAWPADLLAVARWCSFSALSCVGGLAGVAAAREYAAAAAESKNLLLQQRRQQ
jgi:predicted naringenin-chalcone synthase